MVSLINLVVFVYQGTIVTARKFDRERQREYAVTVTATDQAADPLIGICQLTIHILDQNDNNPKFENIRYECKKKAHTHTLLCNCILSTLMLHTLGYLHISRWNVIQCASMFNVINIICA